ncbi:MAG: alpha/beta fold hydrolase [Nocardioidaceae bacterium]|nr:alpha/beta fold hydrolase [Nocardioidaceae bacterium]
MNPSSARREDIETNRGTFAALLCIPSDTSLPRGNALLLPGFTGSKEDFAELLPLLAESGWSAATFDQRGQFETPASSGDDLSLQGWAADAAAVAEALFSTAERVHLVGHSFGGLVAAAAAIAAPERWASLTLLCSGPGAIEGPHGQERLALAAAIERDGLEAVYGGGGEQEHDDETEEFLHRRFLSSSPESLVAMCHALAETPDRSTELTALDLPIAVVRGEDDEAWPHEIQAGLAKSLGTRVVVIPDAAHEPALENPAETRDSLARIWLS